MNTVTVESILKVLDLKTEDVSYDKKRKLHRLITNFKPLNIKEKGSYIILVCVSDKFSLDIDNDFSYGMFNDFNRALEVFRENLDDNLNDDPEAKYYIGGLTVNIYYVNSGKNYEVLTVNRREEIPYIDDIIKENKANKLPGKPLKGMCYTGYDEDGCEVLSLKPIPNYEHKIQFVNGCGVKI